MRTLEKLTIRNFKSIREQTLELGRLNVFIGGNGAGKSNLIQVFRFLKEIVNQNLAQYTGARGGADTLLHHGRKKSTELSLRLEFSETKDFSHAYFVKLMGTAEDDFWLAEETTYFHDRKKYSRPYEHSVPRGRKESGLREDHHQTSRAILEDLESYLVYHFHDTSDTAPAKASCKVDDNRFLRPQAENIAAYLYWMQQTHPDHFANVTQAVRRIAPFFDGFRLEPSRLNKEMIRLEWREKGSDAYFNASSLSDGTLRFICLATLLLQPTLPPVILLDEPELGLHPAAVALLAELLTSASVRAQVLVATQSVTLIDSLEPKDVWVVGREDNQSVFTNLATKDMSDWLDDYSLGDLWQKNLLGGRP